MTTILLSTYNGEKFLIEQIDSLLSQSVPVRIFVRDDGSSDSTLEILKQYEAEGKIELVAGENFGVAKSFFWLLQNASPSDYYAFCDQDDVWDTDKIEVALQKLQAMDNDKPLLYMGTTRHVDSELNPLPKKKVRKRKLTFGTSLIESAAVGCTFIFNHALVSLVQQQEPQDFYIHDWFLHKIAAGCGEIIFDDNPHINYRQHGDNVIGGRKSFSQRLKGIVFGKNAGVRHRDAVALEKYFTKALIAENVATLKTLTQYKTGLRTKWRLMFSKSIRPSKLTHRLFFRLLILFGRL